MYYGKHPEYFSIAIYSLLGIDGNENDDIEILEQDTKGRVMFSFNSKVTSIDDTTGVYSIMICQKTQGEYTYYYPDFNFIVAHNKEEITEDEIAALKNRNDWNKDIDESKMTKVKITWSKTKDNYSGSKKTKIFKDQKKVDFANEYIEFASLGTDKNKRWLYFVRILDNNNSYKRSYVLILNNDNSYEPSYLQQIDDLWNYQDQLKAFKELNNWSIYEE
jgi:hypothetical protein